MSSPLCFVTDVEGNLDYFHRFVDLCPFISFRDSGKSVLQFNDENAIFVFGGDICDKGIGSLRLIRLLLDFKRRHPERVIFILGNRDINKLRFTSELDSVELARWTEIEDLYFVPEHQRVTPKQYLQKLILRDIQLEQTHSPAKTEVITPKTRVVDIGIELYEKYNTLANRLRWMLDATMGSQGDFDRRKEELAILCQRKISEITDEEVARSYVDSMSPAGELTEFLFHGQLGYINGQTLFVHGGVTKQNFGYVPGKQEFFENPHEWIDELNQWCKLELRDWAENPFWKEGRRGECQPTKGGDWGARGANRLIAYVAPKSEPTVIYTNMFDQENNCRYMDKDLASHFNKYGIRRIVVGHQPHGFSPCIARDSRMKIINGDTSYSDMTKPDNRGIACSAIMIKDYITHIKGILPNGAEIEFSVGDSPKERRTLVKQLSETGLSETTEGFNMNDLTSTGDLDPYIGKLVPFPDGSKGWWVKAKLKHPPSDNRSYILCKVCGFKVEYAYVSGEELKLHFQWNRRVLLASQSRISLFPGVDAPKNSDDVNQKVLTLNGEKVLLRTSPLFKIDEVLRQNVFTQWINKMENEPNFLVRSINVMSIDKFGPTNGFAKLNAEVVSKSSNQRIPGVAFLRGASVAVLAVLKDTDTRQKWTIIVKQPRVPIACFDSDEIPSRIVSESSAIETAINVLYEKVGIDLREENNNLINMNKEVYSEETPIYVTPGGSDESFTFFLYKKLMSTTQLEALRQEVNRRNNASPKLVYARLIPFSDLIQVSHDSKAWIAYGLYQHLKQRKESLRTQARQN